MRPIGRETEIAAVLRRVDAAGAGSGSVVLIDGEAGAGKSAVVDAVVAAARERGAVVLAGRSWPLSSSVPYESFVGAVSRHLRSVGDDEARRLTAGLHTLGALIEGFDLTAPDVAPEAFKARAHDALATLVRRIGDGAPVVLVFDDFHWFDQASAEVLQYLCADLRDEPVVVLLAMRADELDARADLRGLVASLRRAVPTEHVPIGRLSPADVTAIVRDRLRGAVSQRLADLVVTRSGGTALFVHELVDDLVEQGAAVETGGVWQLAGGEVPVPRSVRDAIRARLDRVDAVDRSVLEAIAVIGDVATAALVAALVRSDEATVAAACERLRGLRLTVPGVDHRGGRGWTVDHPLVAEVVETEMLPVARARLHRHVLAGDPDAPIGRRARHAVLAGEPEDRPATVRLLAEAGRHAIDGGVPLAAVEPLRVALEWIEADDDPALRSAIERDLGIAFVRQIEPHEALVHLRSAWGWAERTADVHRMVELLPHIDDAEFFLGAAGLGSIDVTGLQARLIANGEWDLLAELASLRISRGGRSLVEPEMVEALAAARSIPAGAGSAATAVMRAMFEQVAAAVEPPDRSCAEQVDAMLEEARNPDATPEQELRMLLTTLDVASQSGDPSLIGRVAALVTEAEQRTGRRTTWRLPIILGAHSAAAGRLDEATIDLVVLTRGGRGHALSVLIEQVVRRWTDGPEAAVAGFAGAGDRYDDDRTAVLYRAVGRMLLGLGTEHEAPAAAELVELADRSPMGVVTRLMLFGAGAQLARALSGDDTALAELDLIGGGDTLPSAWASYVRARRLTGTERAGELLRSADILDRIGRHLEAAERVVDAAEAAPGAVPADRLAGAAGVAVRSGATWLAGRLDGLAPAPRSAPAVAAGGLTARELDVVGLVASGLTNRQIAAELYISVRTVTSHLDHVYTKLGLSSRPDLIEWYRERARPPQRSAE